MPPKKQQKGVTVTTTRRLSRMAGRATGMVSGSNTAGASAKLVKTVA